MTFEGELLVGLLSAILTNTRMEYTLFTHQNHHAVTLNVTGAQRWYKTTGVALCGEGFDGGGVTALVGS